MRTWDPTQPECSPESDPGDPNFSTIHPRPRPQVRDSGKPCPEQKRLEMTKVASTALGWDEVQDSSPSSRCLGKPPRPKLTGAGSQHGKASQVLLRGKRKEPGSWGRAVRSTGDLARLCNNNTGWGGARSSQRSSPRGGLALCQKCERSNQRVHGPAATPRREVSCQLCRP